MSSSTTATTRPVDPARLKVEYAKRKSRGNRYWFIKNVFSKSFPDGFVAGKYIKDVSAHLQNYNYTMDVTGRDHFKSTRLYADIMYALFTDEGMGWEAHYYSYSYDMAAYHMKKLKEMIKYNIYFANIIDLKPTSESIIAYHWPEQRNMTVTPQGLLSFKRGIHAERIYVDDPFRSEDPENPSLEPTQIKKINNIMLEELLQMVKKGGICRIVGTPQTPSDFFFNEGMQEIFNTWITPAIVDEPNGIALWPEWKSFEELLQKRKALGTVRFNREFMAMPVSAANSYLERDKLVPLCVLQPLSLGWHLELNEELVFAGFDIGFKQHPSHLAVFKMVKKLTEQYDVEVHYEMIYQRFLDNWEYTKQIDFLNDVIEFFNINTLGYDNTRGEFMFAEQKGLLSSRMEPVVFNKKIMSSMAANLGVLVEQQRVKFINDSRMISQTLAVNNNLEAAQSPDGHGDSFWSIAMALYSDKDNQPNIRWI